MSVAFVSENDQYGIFSFKSLYEAYLSCRKQKRNTINALRFEADIFGNLFNLQRELVSESYAPARSVCFFTTKPKYREIMAADFRDRVVHHLLVPRLEQIYEPKFIYDSWACRRNKGTHAAVRRLKSFIHQLNRSSAKAAWYLQLDIRSFFTSIDQSILLSLLSSKIKDRRLIQLADVIIRHKPTERCIIRDRNGLRERMPKHKSLFHQPDGLGLPIGNLSSQFFANVYLNELDQYVKHHLKCRHYLRYVDDFVILHPSRDYLEKVKTEIEKFLASRLSLQLHDKMILRRTSSGVDFLGFITRRDYTLVRNRVVHNLREKLAEFEGQMVVTRVNQKSAEMVSTHLHLQPEKVKRLQQVLASYLGHFKHADSYRLVRQLFTSYPFLGEVFKLAPNHQTVQLRTRPDASVQTLFRQYQWFVRQYPNFIVLLQVGRYCECYQYSAERAAKVLKLNISTHKSRGFSLQAGLPMHRLRAAKHRLQNAGVAYIIVAEHGYLDNGVKQRVLTEMYSPAKREQFN